MKYLQNGGKNDWMYGPSKVNSENYSGIYNGQNNGSVQIQHFGTTTYPEHNNYQNNSYIYNAQYGDGNAETESSFYNNQLVNLSLGDAAYTYYKDKNPEEYNYHVNRLKALKNSPSKGVLGTFLPEVTITANKRNGGSLNYLQLLKKGCSIHIKPENKGKFTETKKRTGKTTEELAHSKNPITRKRAIFAQNAAKWHH